MCVFYRTNRAALLFPHAGDIVVIERFRYSILHSIFNAGAMRNMLFGNHIFFIFGSGLLYISSGFLSAVGSIFWVSFPIRNHREPIFVQRHTYKCWFIKAKFSIQVSEHCRPHWEAGSPNEKTKNKITPDVCWPIAATDTEMPEQLSSKVASQNTLLIDAQIKCCIFVFCMHILVAQAWKDARMGCRVGTRRTNACRRLTFYWQHHVQMGYKNVKVYLLYIYKINICICVKCSIELEVTRGGFLHSSMLYSEWWW